MCGRKSVPEIRDAMELESLTVQVPPASDPLPESEHESDTESVNEAHNMSNIV